MSKLKLISYLITCMVMMNELSAQTHLCGVTTSDQNKWLKQYLEELRSDDADFSRSNDIISIPITLHLSARDNGVGRVKVETTLAVLCNLNELFLSSNIEFHLSTEGISFVDDDDIFNNSDLAINKLKMQSLKSTNSINVFVVNKIEGNNVVAYYDFENDWIVMQKNAFIAESKTLAHEIGHFFTLLHPHFGWDTQAWNSNMHSSPVAETSPDGMTPTELANGDNCESAGDKLCDTSPDYNFGIFWQNSCEFGEVVYDANGDEVNPDETLIMSYFSDSCRGVFSDQQINIMHNSIAHQSRNHLDTVINKSIDTIHNNIIQLSPSGSASLVSDSLAFQWNKLAKAEYYYIEFDRSPTFSLDPKGTLTDSNVVWIKNNWLTNTNYYWRVFAWNDSYFCHENTGHEQFSLDVSAIKSNLKKDKIQLNFIEGKCTIGYDIANDKEITVSIYKIDGQNIFHRPIRLSKEFQFISINDLTINNGLFFVSITEKGKIIHSSIVSNF